MTFAAHRRVAVGTALVVCTLAVISAAGAAFPGRPGLVAFVREDTGGGPQIWSVAPGSREARQLTHFAKPVINGSPAWSANGKELIFGTDLGIMRLDLRTGRVNRLTKTGGNPAWSPDGRDLIYARHAFDACTDLYVLNLVTRKTRRYTATHACESQPAWSPDGRTIAFISSNEDSSLVILKALRGSDTRLVVSPEHADSPAWAPDGNSIAYVVRGRGIEIYNRRTKTATPLKIRSLGAGIEDVDWSPDGSQLVYARVDPGSSGKPTTALFVVKLDGSGDERLTSSVGGDSEPNWQPVR
jgi:TolB protein